MRAIVFSLVLVLAGCGAPAGRGHKSTGPASDDGGSQNGGCTGLSCFQMDCGAAPPTTVSGKVTDSLSAFANRPGGGAILFGLDEKQGFKVVGVGNLQKAQTDVADWARNVMEPPVHVEASRVATRRKCGLHDAGTERVHVFGCARDCRGNGSQAFASAVRGARDHRAGTLGRKCRKGGGSGLAGPWW